MCLALMGFCIRDDLLGVSSFVRALGLHAMYYKSLLHLFHSSALDVGRLTALWTATVLNFHPGLLRFRDRIVLVGDGIKVPKAGCRMPGVKQLHQESDSNTKPTFIMGHSCQAVGVLLRAGKGVTALPLASRIHEGVKCGNFDKRTLLDKMIKLLERLGIKNPFYFVADGYYASRKIAMPLVKQASHLVTRCRNNTVAYEPVEQPERRKRGRPRIYGNKIALKGLFDGPLQAVISPLYGEENVQLLLCSRDLVWRPVGRVVRFVAVAHPVRGRCILMSTDLELNPVDIVRLYGYRFKIELMFKHSLHVVGSYLYHFWMAMMQPVQRGGGIQYLHRKTKEYREHVACKMDAYHRYIQLGVIAQGILVALATTTPGLVWRHFGSWFRTVREGVPPSERAVALALRNSYKEFLLNRDESPIPLKFLQKKIDPDRAISDQWAA